MNAFTTRDNTSYFEDLPSEHLELGLKLEADRLLNLKLDDDTFQPERQVVVSERKLRSVDSPFGLVEEQLFATAYTQHPIRLAGGGLGPGSAPHDPRTIAWPTTAATTTPARSPWSSPGTRGARGVPGALVDPVFRADPRPGRGPRAQNRRSRPSGASAGPS